jgi:hypothetical protein
LVGWKRPAGLEAALKELEGWKRPAGLEATLKELEGWKRPAGLEAALNSAIDWPAVGADAVLRAMERRTFGASAAGAEILSLVPKLGY